jgi:hypothetical protein
MGVRQRNRSAAGELLVGCFAAYPAHPSYSHLYTTCLCTSEHGTPPMQRRSWRLHTVQLGQHTIVTQRLTIMHTLLRSYLPLVPSCHTICAADIATSAAAQASSRSVYGIDVVKDSRLARTYSVTRTLLAVQFSDGFSIQLQTPKPQDRGLRR